jgi:tight adherence protein C
VGSFVRAMIQADQLGMSMGRILRVQAADARLKRQAAAEERAMKAPVKMLFPTVLFIFPAMFLVILGPAFIHLFELFLCPAGVLARSCGRVATSRDRSSPYSRWRSSSCSE